MIDRFVDAEKENIFGQTLLHLACAAVRSSSRQAATTLKFVETLIKAQYPVHLADKEGKLPICYLIHKDVTDETLFKVFEWHIKYAKFQVLKKPI